MQPPSACPSLQPKRSRSLTISTQSYPDAAKPANEPFMAPPKKKYRRLALPAPAPAAIDAATDAPTHGSMCTTPRVAAALSALTNAARRPAGGTRRLSAALPPPRKKKGAGRAEDVGSGITQVVGAPLHPHPRPHPYPHLRAASEFWSVVPPHKESVIRGEPALPLYVWDVARSRGGKTRPRTGARPADWEDQASMTDAPRSARCACCLQLAATAGGAGAGE